MLNACKKFEAEELTRRSALRKFGITSSMALFGMFAIDDLARVAIKKMEENKLTHEVGETVAKEFKNSGIAFAGADGSSSGNPCGNDTGTVNCEACNGDHYQTCLKSKSAAVCYNKSVSCETHCNDTTADAASLKACWGTLG